jgi:hypothetical protein
MHVFEKKAFRLGHEALGTGGSAARAARGERIVRRWIPLPPGKSNTGGYSFALRLRMRAG